MRSAVICGGAGRGESVWRAADRRIDALLTSLWVDEGLSVLFRGLPARLQREDIWPKRAEYDFFGSKRRRSGSAVVAVSGFSFMLDV